MCIARSTFKSSAAMNSARSSCCGVLHNMCCNHSSAFQCSFCGAVFQSANEADEHVREKHFYPEL
ncbi:hypothetical protein COEREDRAFT_82843 [Coemansia reversa NRRL 1564]|uniref:C2H2-type domain-containing protein n=1 Tax=Coemansia reversa (strain ATCC 12441 / NRRL 1564) TaxID=763665 RepID=A0A2G5B5P7_COERN|nr:hypothetical protein COEREDRAFT_82843 [Coemansia reversa NRRL 1564]|eukprot:PIA14329.1 hypothetical protein COEREDRAFT_82843 [Coemansia reversa NRRL 1564]